jgi:hypothetical protein
MDVVQKYGIMYHRSKAFSSRRAHISGMSTSPVINALRRKRAEISGSIRGLEGRIHNLCHSLAHVDATLKLFDPDAEPKMIKPVRPRRPQNRIFERKELSIRVMNALREAQDGSATVEAMVARIMADKGLQPVAEPTIRRMVATTLTALRKCGVVASDKASGRWAINQAD